MDQGAQIVLIWESEAAISFVQSVDDELDCAPRVEARCPRVRDPA